MYLSSLLVNLGANPDRPRPGRLWLRNIYAVHQRLCMAFPAARRKSEDPLFLQPYNPADFCEAQSRTRRSSTSGFLYRVDPLYGGGAVILVMSAAEPDWIYAFRNADMLLAAPPQVKPYNPGFSAGERLRFRARVNLSKKSKQYAKRVAFTWEESQDPGEAVREWFERKSWARPATGQAPVRAFGLEDFELVELGWVIGFKPSAADRSKGQDSRQVKFRSALLSGLLSVENADALSQLVTSGIGSGKAFGFGLLSLVNEL